jgi:hypothetical protein
MANHQNIETIHGSPDWDPHWRVVSLVECQQCNFNEHSEDTALLGIFINIRHYTEGAGYQSLANKQPTNGSGATPNKQQRTYFKSKGANYDRIFTFICLNSPGQCFNIISQTPNESDKIMKYAKNHSSIGDIFAIIEPDMARPGIQNVMTVDTSNELIPIKWDDSLIPTVPLVPPPKGHQRYFILKGEKIEMFKVGAEQASCKGQLCDRQKPPSRSIGCGCLYMQRASDIVFEQIVKFSYVDESGNNEHHTVLHHRSFRTTNLFTKPIHMGADPLPFYERKRDIRTVVRNIQEIVNSNGGWTIIGWYRKGEVEDASAPSNENDSKIEGSNKPIHIAYLFPTNKEAVLPLLEAEKFDPAAPGAAPEAAS